MSRTPLKKTYDVNETASMLKASPELIRRKIRSGEIKAVKPFRHWIIT